MRQNVIFMLMLVGMVGLAAHPSQALTPPRIDVNGYVQLNTAPAKQTVHLLPVKLETDITPLSQPNERVEARFILPVKLNQSVLPVDSRLKGVIKEHKPGERFGRKARLAIQWQEWCPINQACRPIPLDATSQYHSVTNAGTSSSAFKRFLPLQILSYGISIPLGLTAMPLWSTLFIEQGVGAAIGATYETLKPEEESETSAKRLVKGALNSTSLPTLTRFVKKAPDIAIPTNTALWMPADKQLIQWLAQPDAQPTEPVNTLKSVQ
jgi:hypothetical protein